MEERMTAVKNFAIASALIVGLGLAVGANAGEAKMSDCIQLGKQFTTAIETAQPGETTDQARKLGAAARSYCSVDSYNRGVSLYQKALALLGK
jgi:hypothetical protein